MVEEIIKTSQLAKLKNYYQNEASQDQLELLLCFDEPEGEDGTVKTKFYKIVQKDSSDQSLTTESDSDSISDVDDEGAEYPAGPI